MSALARAEGRTEPARSGASDTSAARPRRRPRPGEGPVFFAAGFWRRGAAALLDAAFVLPVGVLAAWLAGTLAGLERPRPRGGADRWIEVLLAVEPALVAAVGLVVAVFLLYGLLFIGAASQTPGMRALRIRVIDAYGDPPSVPRAAARAAGAVASIATLGLGFLWIALDREKRSLPDWLAGTFVVRI